MRRAGKPLTQPAKPMIIFSLPAISDLNFMEQNVFSLRSAIIAAKRTIPYQQQHLQCPQEQQSPSEPAVSQAASKLGRVRQLLREEIKRSEGESGDYYIDLASAEVRKRPPFSRSLREMVLACHTK